MICKSRRCKYWYDECIRKNVVITNGVCPFYQEENLSIQDIFKSNITGSWWYNSKRYTAPLLQVLAIATDRVHTIYISKEEGEPIAVLPVSFNTYAYLPIDTNIFSMYIESFLYDYLSDDEYYKVTHIDCNKSFIHVIGEKKIDI